jgi:hypothetical protein
MRATWTLIKVSFVICALVVVGIIITQHAQELRGGETYTRAQILEIIDNYVFDNDRSMCKEMIVATCPAARDTWTNEPAPQVKVACVIKKTADRRADILLVGIFGTKYAEPAYVTGIVMPRMRFESTCIRDGCRNVGTGGLPDLLR